MHKGKIALQVCLSVFVVCIISTLATHGLHLTQTKRPAWECTALTMSHAGGAFYRQGTGPGVVARLVTTRHSPNNSTFHAIEQSCTAAPLAKQARTFLRSAEVAMRCLGSYGAGCLAGAATKAIASGNIRQGW